MISRVWRGWTTRENAGAYETLLRGTILPGIARRGIDGYRGVSLTRRDDGETVEFVTTMSFDSLDAVRAFAGADHAAAVVPPAARALLSRFDERATHYDVIVPAETGRTSTAERLAGALERTVRGPMWHGPALAELVGGLGAQDAAARGIAGAHSIWELVLHIAAWANIARERLAGTAGTPTAEENFPPIGEPTEPRWRDALVRLETSYDALASAVRRLDEATLAAPTAGLTDPAWVLVQGVVEHGAYHGGQIALLRRSLGIDPPKS